jgi:transcriptional regulator with XRE-family HTH domain
MTTHNLVGPQVKNARYSPSGSLTQEQLAVKLQILGWDIDRFGVSKIERQQRQVTDTELWMLAQALEVAIADLFPPDVDQNT